MQYPPQQPASQPSYSPAEMVMQEQPQAYPPQTPVYVPQNQQFVPGQEIAIYANRTQVILRTTILAICLLVLILLIPIFLIVGFTTGGTPQASDIAPIIFTLAVLLAGIVFIGWLTWRMVSDLLSKRQPVLLINREGITVGRMPMLSGFFIPWAEIEALAPSRYIIYKYLCIIPRNQDQFLLRFKPLERFSRRLNSAIGSPLAVPQMYLGKPAEELLNAVYYGYANELNYYHVQLRH